MDGIRSFKLPIAPAERIRAGSSGRVSNIETLDWTLMVPAEGGVFAAEIFGPWEWWRCACGALEGTGYSADPCGECGELMQPGPLRRERYGHVDLAFPVVHPEAWRRDSEALCEASGLGSEELKEVVLGERLLDGPMELPTGGAALWALVEGRGCDPEALGLVRCVPVVPAGLREPVFMPGGKVRWHHVNTLHMRLVNRARRVRVMADLSPPQHILVNEAAQLQHTLETLLDNEGAPKPAVDDEGRRLRSLDQLGGAAEFLRSLV